MSRLSGFPGIGKANGQAAVTDATDLNAHTIRGDAYQSLHSAWHARAGALAIWTETFLLNRIDVWGGYNDIEDRERIVAFADGHEGPLGKTLTRPAVKDRGKVFLTRTLIENHFRATRSRHVIGLHTTSTDNTSRWGAIEIDRHDADTSAESNLKAALAWFEHLRKLGFRPLLLDSDGKGGYHLLIVFTEPVPTTTVFRFLRWLIGNFAELGLHKQPETFPKQEKIQADGYGNWLRLVGRHHTRNHWARVWDGTKFLEGANAVDFVLDVAGDSASLIPSIVTASEAANSEPKKESVGWKRAAADHDGDDVTVARAALAALKTDRADHYDSWLQVGMILHSVDPSDAMMVMWEDWSKSSQKFKQGECAAKWNSFTSGGGLGLGTLIRWAQEDNSTYRADRQTKRGGEHEVNGFPSDEDHEPPVDPLCSGVSDDILDQAPPPETDSPQMQEPKGDPDKKKVTIAAKIVELAHAAGVQVFHTPDQTPYATISVGAHRENYPIQSTVFRNWLRRLYYMATQRAANANAIAEAVAILAAIATYDGEEMVVYTRVAMQGNVIYLDLADANWRAVEITRDGWRVVTEPPVRFRRPTGMYPLPEPQRGGTINLLRPFVNCSDSAFRLIVAFMIAALRLGRPFPVLFLRGEQGSAKSWLARLIRSLIDPNKAPLRLSPRNERDMIIAATNGWIVAYDNLSFVPDWLSDGLCCLATGAGFGTRTLFTDNEEILFQAMRPSILTAIEDVVTRGDLMDRCLSIEMEPIPADRRRTEAELEAAIAPVRPLILGALLDAVAAALANLPSTRLPTLPRMADFALWVSAAEPALGWTRGAFLADYSGNREQSNEVILANSPLYEPLVKVLDQHDCQWQGTSTELLDALAICAGEKIASRKSWPSTPAVLTNQLNRLAPALRAKGITVERDRQARKRIVRIEMNAGSRHSSSPSSPPRDFQGPAGDDPIDGGGLSDDPGGHGNATAPTNNHGFWETVTTGDDGDDVLHHSHDSDSFGPYWEGF